MRLAWSRLGSSSLPLYLEAFLFFLPFLPPPPPLSPFPAEVFHTNIMQRNPWGQRSETGCGEWYGAWADGSKEWNTYTINALHHEFGDNGIFWMTYEDMTENFKYIYRTRLFDRGWSMAQKWTSILVPWLPGFLKKRFIVDIKEKSTVVIVLSQVCLFALARRCS